MLFLPSYYLNEEFAILRHLFTCQSRPAGEPFSRANQLMS